MTLTRRLLVVVALVSIAALGVVVVLASRDDGEAEARRESPTGPYVVTAIDYHFHDAHPTLPLGPGRDLVFKNVGRNVHNVTIPALAISRNVRPGKQLVIEDVATALGGAGRYLLICELHQDRGMTGIILVAGA